MMHSAFNLNSTYWRIIAMKTLTARSYNWKIMLTIFSGWTQSAVVPTATRNFRCCTRTVITFWTEHSFGTLIISPHVSTTADICRVWNELVLVRITKTSGYVHFGMWTVWAQRTRQHACKTTGAEETLTTLLAVDTSWWNCAASNVAE